MNELTAREALFAETFKEIDALLKRVEELPGLIATAQERLLVTTKILDSSAASFRAEMNVVGEVAKKDIVDHLVLKQKELVQKTLQEQYDLMHEAARTALHSESFSKIERLARTLAKATRGSLLETLYAQLFMTVVGSFITSIVAYYIYKPR